MRSPRNYQHGVRPLYCECGHSVYRSEGYALRHALTDLPADVPSVYRCPGSKSWHITPPDGLPAEVLESAGRLLAYQLLTKPRVIAQEFHQAVGIDDGPAGDKRRKNVRKKSIRPILDCGAAVEYWTLPPVRTQWWELADAALANRIVQVGVDHAARERAAGRG